MRVTLAFVLFAGAAAARAEVPDDAAVEAQMQEAMLQTQEAMLEAEASRWKHEVDSKYEAAQKLAAAKKAVQASFVQLKAKLLESDGDDAAMEAQMQEAMLQTQEAMLEAEAARWKKSVDEQYEAARKVAEAKKAAQTASFVQMKEETLDDAAVDAQMEEAMLQTQEAMLEAEAARWKKQVDSKYEAAQKLAAAKKAIQTAFIQLRADSEEDQAVDAQMEEAMLQTQEAMLEAEASRWKREVDSKFEAAQKLAAAKKAIQASFVQLRQEAADDAALDAQMEEAMLQTQEAMLEAEAARWKKEVDSKYEAAQKLAEAKKALKASFIQMKTEEDDDAALQAQMEEAMLQTQEAMLEAEAARWKKAVDVKYQQAQAMTQQRQVTVDTE